ncbi:hypothetical protein GQ55_3G430800 [Panicum hallii var. hallii]|uniref:Pectinesterase inhibitor domain-containing protein n=1 Tax=Panicum hallii var. hallii TaxID=1504633 RepID=A0A2T7EHU1_9POAL|nr:hypothetical protein GQ55_3G430800 [Panicum hallii var. hallii]
MDSSSLLLYRRPPPHALPRLFFSIAGAYIAPGSSPPAHAAVGSFPPAHAAAVSSPPAHTAAILVLLLFASAGAGEAAATAALDEVCGRLGSYYVTPALCVSALCADPSAPCRDARDAPAVATLAARLVADNATAARDNIEKLSSPPPRRPPRAAVARAASST